MNEEQTQEEVGEVAVVDEAPVEETPVEETPPVDEIPAESNAAGDFIPEDKPEFSNPDNDPVAQIVHDRGLRIVEIQNGENIVEVLALNPGV